MIDRNLLQAAPITSQEARLSFAANFSIITSSFLLLTLLSWPILLSFDLWIFKDRSSFLNLDYLYFTRHLRIGVDIGYSYGLLPILLQHVAFTLFGVGYKPMIACTFLVLLLSALFWACLLEHLPRGRRWLIAIVAISPLILIVNPNWPYSLAVLAMMFAFLFVLKDRTDLALAISAIGSLSVPSLPLVVTLLLGICLLYNWWRSPQRSLAQLARQFAPGLATYALLALLLGCIFSFASLAATALPLTGSHFYKESGFGKANAFLAFLCPQGYSTKYYLAYYLGSSVTWFMLCTVLLFASSTFIATSVLRKRRRLTPAHTLIVIFSVVQGVFIFRAYGPRGQHALYEGVLAAATLVGISLVSVERVRNAALLIFACSGAMGSLGTIYKNADAWRTTAPGPSTLGLYAGAGMSESWSRVLKLSQHRRTLLLAYATGQHLYYPTLTDPDAWFMIHGLLLPGQELAVLDQIRGAEVVVEDLASPSPVVNDKIQAELATMHVLHADGPYRILEH